MDPRRLLPFVFCAACGDAKVELPDDSSPGGGDDSATPVLECDAAGNSMCGNEASLLRGSVRLAPGLEAGNTSGDLVIALAHEAYGGGEGGGYHTHIVLNAVDLAAGPVPFELDMCAGGEMWTEENCLYGLVVVLDANGNNGHSHLLPDDGEPSTRVPNLDVSCGGESPCLDVVLDCVDGDTCVSFSEQACACSDETCPSEYGLCK